MDEMNGAFEEKKRRKGGKRLMQPEKAAKAAKEPRAEDGEAVAAVEAREQDAAEEAADAEHHERPGDGIRREAGDRAEERLDVAVRREVRVAKSTESTKMPETSGLRTSAGRSRVENVELFVSEGKTRQR